MAVPDTSGPTNIHMKRNLVESVHTKITQLSLIALLLSPYHIFHIPVSTPTLNVLSHHKRNNFLTITRCP